MEAELRTKLRQVKDQFEHKNLENETRKTEIQLKENNLKQINVKNAQLQINNLKLIEKLDCLKKKQDELKQEKDKLDEKQRGAAQISLLSSSQNIEASEEQNCKPVDEQIKRQIEFNKLNVNNQDLIGKIDDMTQRFDTLKASLQSIRANQAHQLEELKTELREKSENLEELEMELNMNQQLAGGTPDLRDEHSKTGGDSTKKSIYDDLNDERLELETNIEKELNDDFAKNVGNLIEKFKGSLLTQLKEDLDFTKKPTLEKMLHVELEEQQKKLQLYTKTCERHSKLIDSLSDSNTNFVKKDIKLWSQIDLKISMIKHFEENSDAKLCWEKKINEIEEFIKRLSAKLLCHNRNLVKCFNERFDKYKAEFKKKMSSESFN